MKEKGQNRPFQSRGYVVWSKEMDNIFARVMLDQMNQGNKADGDWKAQAYQAVVDEINTKMGAKVVARDNVRNRLRAWKKCYGLISDIQKRSGVSLWDEEKKMIVITSENRDEWEKYLMDHKDARSYANKVLENWDDIVLLCAKDIALGDGAEHYQDANHSVNGEDDVQSVSSFESVDGGSISKRALQGEKSSGETSSRLSKKSKNDAKVGDALITVANFLNSFIESRKKEEVKKFTGKEILDVLTEIPGLNRMDIPKAVTKYRCGDPEHFKLLLELPIDERRDFVEYFLNEA
ncbi:hypothetical protein LINPERPRIM_LOCUS14729 [Linum perenne]